MTSPNNAWSPEWVVAPGEILVEALAEREMTQAELARRMARPLKTVSEIATGKAAITPETAIQLELTLGISASFWSGVEARYREGLARQRAREELKGYVDWASSFPVKELQAAGQLPATNTPELLVASVLSFFGVSSPAGFENQWSKVSAGLRVGKVGVTSDESLAAWLRWGERTADWADIGRYNERKFREALSRIRRLSRAQLLADAVEQTSIELRSAGVAFVVLPALSHAPASGAARWVRGSRPLIQLSVRYRTDDQFWYSLYHEAGHLITGQRRTDVVEDVGQLDLQDNAEAAADQFARDALLPKDQLEPFLAEGDFGRAAIREFAKEAGVAPGIVVGRLEHDGHVARGRLSDLKRRVDLAM